MPRRAAPVALLLVAALLAVPPWTGDPSAPRVAAVGDSFLRQLEYYGPLDPDSTTAFTDTLVGEGWQGSVRGENGWTTVRVRRLARAELAQGAEALVVVSGVNDVAWVRLHPDPRTARQQVATAVQGLLTDAAGLGCLVWPTVSRALGQSSTAVRANRTVRVINRTLRAAAAQRPGAVVVPEWGRLLIEHPEWRARDGLHLNERGEEAFQQVLLEALRTCVPSAAPLVDAGQA